MAMTTSKIQLHVSLLLISFPLFLLGDFEPPQQQQAGGRPSYSGDFNYKRALRNQIKLRVLTNRINVREFIEEHKKVRQQIGEPLLQWDKNLTRYARRFASRRISDCDMIHSYGPYGENIYWGSDYNQHTAANAVRAWASEVENYDPTTNKCAESQMCGHYKQIVWRSSQKLGCARVKCNNGGTYIICSYDPPGNYVNENPFGEIFNPGPPTGTPPPPPPYIPPEQG